MGAGVVDFDYCDNVGLVLFNHSDTDFSVKKGDRIAQLILEKIENPPVQEVPFLPDTQRGQTGFGSTGVAGAPPRSTANPTPGTPKEDQNSKEAVPVRTIVHFRESVRGGTARFSRKHTRSRKGSSQKFCDIGKKVVYQKLTDFLAKKCKVRQVVGPRKSMGGRRFHPRLVKKFSVAKPTLLHA